MLFLGQVIRGIHTSGVVWFYFLLSVICGAPVLYGQIHWHPPPLSEWTLFLFHYVLTIIIFLVICFADRLPQREKSSREDSPKESASILSKILFSWFTSLVILALKKTLTLSDLWRVRERDKSSVVYSSFNKNWKSSLNRRSEYTPIPSDDVSDTELEGRPLNIGEKNMYTIDKSKDNITKRDESTNSGENSEKGVFRSIAKTFGWYFLGGSVFMLIDNIQTLVNPLIMK